MININYSYPIIGIYKITSPNNRIYIGQSTNIEKRWYDYHHYGIKSQHKLRRSFKKYGIENHKFEILEECNESELNQKEIEYIKKFKCLKEGLNIKEGGIGGKMSQSVKDKISKSNKGKKRSEEIKKKLSNSKKGVKSHRKGKNLSISHISNMIETRKKFRKPVLQFDLNNKLINEFNGIREAGKICKLDNGTITRCCKGKIKQYKGFIWKYKNQ